MKKLLFLLATILILSASFSMSSCMDDAKNLEGSVWEFQTNAWGRPDSILYIAGVFGKRSVNFYVLDKNHKIVYPLRDDTDIPIRKIKKNIKDNTFQWEGYTYYRTGLSWSDIVP